MVRRTIERPTGHLPTEPEAFDAMLEHALAAWGYTARVYRADRVFASDGRFDVGLRPGRPPILGFGAGEGICVAR